MKDVIIRPGVNNLSYYHTKFGESLLHLLYVCKCCFAEAAILNWVDPKSQSVVDVLSDCFMQIYLVVHEIFF